MTDRANVRRPTTIDRMSVDIPEALQNLAKAYGIRRPDWYVGSAQGGWSNADRRGPPDTPPPGRPAESKSDGSD